MVNATVDNTPVSILLKGGESTTVPSSETWRVSIHLGNMDRTAITIDGRELYSDNLRSNSANPHYLDVTLTGGQTIAETQNSNGSAIFITGFVVS